MTALLLRPAAGWPTTRREREAHRAHLRSTMVTTAVREARRAGRTRACQGRGLDHQMCAGAAVCLCDCHDPQEDA